MHPRTVRAVRTDYLSAGHPVLDGETTNLPAPDTAVRVIEMTGDFTSNGPRPPEAKAPRGDVLTLVLTAKPLVECAYGLGNTRHELERLGRVHVLDV